MWVRTTVTIKRWTEEKSGRKIERTERTDITRLPSWKRGHPASVDSSSDLSSFSEGENKETDRHCWKHQQCPGHIIHPFSDCGHHNRCMRAVSHCNCEYRSSSQDVGLTCSKDGGSTCFNIIHAPCFELIPEEEYVERIWYSWCRSHRPISVAIIHHPTHHMYMPDDLNDEDEDLEENPLSITNHLSPSARPTDPNTGSPTGVPDLSAPITIWRSESPMDKCQEDKVIKNIKKKKEKEKDEEEMVDEKTNLKKAKGKSTKKKCPVKSESFPADLSESVSPREPVRTPESSPESREGLESEDSYERGKEKPSSEDIVESSSPKKKEKCSAQAKKNGTKNLQTRKTSKRKSPPMSNPTLS